MPRLCHGMWRRIHSFASKCQIMNNIFSPINHSSPQVQDIISQPFILGKSQDLPYSEYLVNINQKYIILSMLSFKICSNTVQFNTFSFIYGLICQLFGMIFNVFHLKIEMSLKKYSEMHPKQKKHSNPDMCLILSHILLKFSIVSFTLLH